jgi:hypothetical protein
VDRTDAQTADLDRTQSLFGFCTAKPGWHVAADRQQGGDWLTIQTG